MNRKQISNGSTRHTRHLVVSGGLVLVLLLLTYHSARVGFSSVVKAYAGQTKDIGAANLAVQQNSSDPDAHYVLGSVLEAHNDFRGAAAAYDHAVLGRPDQCVLWLSLARVRELNGETSDAEIAARRSVPLAPYYAQPHWQLGNILLRTGQSDEAFKELRLAVASDPTLMPAVIDLAWRISGGDVEFLKQAIQPATPEAYEALGRFLRHQGDLTAALSIYAAAGGNASERERIANLARLILAKRFKEAFDLWVAAHPESKAGVLIDPGYEEERDLHEPGFGWRTTDTTQGFRLSLDSANPKQGRASLKVDFDGNSDPASPVISQLVLVEPRSQYRLSSSARTEAIVGGGLPGLVVVDAGTSNLLGRSEALPQITNGWRDYTLDFNSGEATAIQINLQRQGCPQLPCPIFGRLWLDNLWLQKL